MSVARRTPMISRRALLCAVPLVAQAQRLDSDEPAKSGLGDTRATRRPVSQKGRKVPPAVRRYSDPSTEFIVYRLTDPAYRSLLPLQSCRAISQRGGFLLYSSDRAGKMQVFRMDLKSGESQQLTDVERLDPESVTLVPGDRSMLLFDGPALKQVQLGNLRERMIHQVRDGAGRGRGFAVSEDGLHVCYVETEAGLFRLRLVRVNRPAVLTPVESREPISMPWPRPRRAGLLYHHSGGSLMLTGYDGTGNRMLKTAAGRPGAALWQANGRSVLYLNTPLEAGKPVSIRENRPDTNEDTLVAPTSQFGSFTRNSDGTMFAGASASKGAPYILLLLRMTRRELTLCEHGASDPASVPILFAPSSQKIYFQSDRDGKPAIYGLNVDRFVAETDEEAK